MRKRLVICPELSDELKDKFFCFTTNLPLVYIPKYIKDLNIKAQLDLTDEPKILENILKETLWHLMRSQTTLLILGQRKNTEQFKNQNILGYIPCEIIELPNFIIQYPQMFLSEFYIPRKSIRAGHESLSLVSYSKHFVFLNKIEKN